MDVEPTFQKKFIKPQQEWKWGIAIYLYLAGMGAGSFIIGIMIIWFANHLLPQKTWGLWNYSINLTKAAILWGPLFVAVGAPFLVLDLGKKMKFYTACLNPKTSWLARGFLILSTFIVVGLIIFGISARLGSVRTTVWFVLEVIGVILAFATAIYTGILLQSVKYVPIWNTPLLPLLFLASALSTGSMGIILSLLGFELIPSNHGLLKTLTYTEQILILIEAFVLALYLYSRHRQKDQGETSVRLLLSGQLKFLFWVGIVFIGFIFPILLEFLYTHSGQPSILIATGLFLLSGGFFLRLGVLASGIKEQLPMHKLIEIKIKMSALGKG
jgi:formate-dependent nitrite reductase membrane component NrfD